MDVYEDKWRRYPKCGHLRHTEPHPLAVQASLKLELQFEIRFVNHMNLLFKSKNTNVELEMSRTGGCYTRQPKQSRWTMF